MGGHAGHIELDRAVDAIQVGTRHRTDMGDLDALADSIARKGLLQPPTITPGGVLVCGARRIAAVKKLGLRTVSVWVRSSISTRLEHLLAEQDDNDLHKDLTPLEQAALYREIKTVMAEDAARRKASAQFQDGHEVGNHGPAESAGPSPAPESEPGDARRQAAQLVTGAASYTRLEQVGYLERLAADPDTPESLRAEVRAGLAQIESGGPVDPIYRRARAATGTRASEKTTRDTDPGATQRPADAHAPMGADDVEQRAERKKTPAPWPVRSFVLMWTDMRDWWAHYDPTVLAEQLTDEQLTDFFATVEATAAFAERLRAAADEHAPVTQTGRAHLHAV